MGALQEISGILQLMMGIVPFQPPKQFDPQVDGQLELIPGTEAARIQAEIDARGWSYRFVSRIEGSHLIMVERKDIDRSLTLVDWPATLASPQPQPEVDNPIRRG